MAQGSPTHNGADGVPKLYDQSFNAVLNISKNNAKWRMISQLPSRIKREFLTAFSDRNMLTDEIVGFLVDETTTTFNLRKAWLTNQGLQKLRVCSNLVDLDMSIANYIRREDINAGLLSIFVNCHQLKNVNLQYCIFLVDVTVMGLVRNNPYLVVLNLEGCERITDEALIAIGDSCSSIKKLELSHTQVSERGMRYILGSPCSLTLQEIGLGYCRGISVLCFRQLVEECTSLKALTFHYDRHDDIEHFFLVKCSRNINLTVDVNF